MRAVGALITILGSTSIITDNTSAAWRVAAANVAVGAGDVKSAATSTVEHGRMDFQTTSEAEAVTPHNTKSDPGNMVHHDGSTGSAPSQNLCHLESSQDESCVVSIEDDRQQPAVDGGVRGLAVQTGTRNGISIEYVGTVTGTIPSTKVEQPQEKQRQHLNYDSDHSDVNQMRNWVGKAKENKMEVGLEYEVLRCESGDSAVTREDGRVTSFTLKGICNNMLQKLMNSGYQNEVETVRPSSSSAEGHTQVQPANGDAADAPPMRGTPSLVDRSLAILTAPAWYLFGILGSMPGWFSEAVFKVSLEDEGSDVNLQQQILLVQDPPRSLQIACALLAPSLRHARPTPLTLARTRGSSPLSLSTWSSWFGRVGRSMCHLNSPFPGKSVVHPCRPVERKTPSWMGNLLQKILASVGIDIDSFGANDEAASGGWSRACHCASDESGPCVVRAAPGREPCVYVEIAGSERWGQTRRHGADAINATSAVELATYSLPLAKDSMQTVSSSITKAATQTLEENRGFQRPAAGLLETWEALRTSAAERGLPSSVTVPTYMARLAVGAILLFLARPLSESRVFHYLLSALLGGVVAATAMLLRALGNPRQKLLRLCFVTVSLFWILMGAGGNLVPSPASVASALPAKMLGFWNNGFGGYPWAGKAFYGASALAGVLMTRWQGLFLDEDESWLNGQASIRRILTVSGVLLVYSGVSDTEVGLILVLVALTAPSLAHFALRYTMWRNKSKWYRAGPKLSQSEYERQGDEYTRMALEALHEVACEDWRDLRKQVKPSTRKRMAAFMKSGEHYRQQEDDDGAGRRWGLPCCIQ